MAADSAMVLDFWFGPQAGPAAWFNGEEAFDRLVAERLGALHEQAASGDLAGWAGDGDGALALCILLDQVPRNIFRGTARAFATDAAALDVARKAVAAGMDLPMTEDRRAFFYLPFEHAEAMEEQRTAVRLFAGRTTNPVYLDYACRHLVVIAEFGRFPHRNPLLGRDSTPEEQEYLARPGAGF
ncbi:DUF924 family protein [Niveispirillum irakense]|uniref:DUF924 family protein n=1 Tax=Niveispirillum irakense TaxID=34011 RepID=UPI00041DAB10|nr:DUF924 family protein [Niveispirillum irakense]